MRKPKVELCVAWFEIGNEYEAALTALSCELLKDHEGPHQETVRWNENQEVVP